MERNKTEKLTVCFEKPELIKEMVGDIAVRDNRSLSAVMENIILTSLLPENREAREIAEHYLYAGEGIGKTLEVIFNVNATGVEYEPKHENLLPLVQYAQTYAIFCSTALTGDEEELPYLCKMIEEYLDSLEKRAEEVDEIKKIYLMKDVRRGTKLLEEIKEKPQESKVSDIYSVVLNNWEYCKGWQSTYRLLGTVAKIEDNRRETPQERIDLLQAIRDVSASW